jgi:hypothetical protein
LFLLALLLLNCEKDNSVDGNVEFYGEETFTFYEDLVFSSLDFEFLEDESMAIAGFTESKERGMLFIDSSLNIIKVETIEEEPIGLYRNIDILQSTEGYINHLSSASTEAFGGRYDMTLSKLDEIGTTIDKRKIDNEFNVHMSGHVQLPNEDFVILSLDASEKGKFYVHRITEDGEMIFSKSFEEIRDINRFGSLKYSEYDNSIIVLHSFRGDPADEFTVKASKMDTDANVLQTSELLTDRVVSIGALEIITLRDGGVVLYCSVKSLDEEDYHIKLIKLNSDFDVLWSKEYPDKGSNFVRDVIESNDNKLLVLSQSGDIGSGQLDIILSLIDSDGIIEKRSVFGGEYSETGYKIYQKQNGNIIIVGSQDNLDDNNPSKLFTLETNSKGIPI